MKTASIMREQAIHKYKCIQPGIGASLHTETCRDMHQLPSPDQWSPVSAQAAKMGIIERMVENIMMIPLLRFLTLRTTPCSLAYIKRTAEQGLLSHHASSMLFGH